MTRPRLTPVADHLAPVIPLTRVAGGPSPLPATRPLPADGHDGWRRLLADLHPEGDDAA